MSSAAHAPATRPQAPFWRVFPWLVVTLQLAWWSLGVWPVVPVEGDEQGVIFGVQGMLTGDIALLQVRYYYEIQPGAYHVLATLTRLTGASVDGVFALATVLGALAFAFAGAVLLRTVFGWPLGWLVVAMLCCQEVTTAGYYLNTSAMAAALAVSGVIFSGHTSRGSWAWAGLLLALAGWVRADSLLIAPACFGLILWQQRGLRTAIGRTSAIAITATAGVALFYFLSGTSPLQGASAYAGRDNFSTDLRVFAEISLQLLSPALLLAALGGTVLLLGQRNFSLLFLTLTGCAASLFFYGASLTTPKYFYYFVPFALLPALHLIDVIVRRVRELPRGITVGTAIIGGLIFAGDGLLGLRTLQPRERYFATLPTGLALGQHTRGEKKFELVVGAGELALNADGFRMRTGAIFGPWCWHREKTLAVANLALLREQLAHHQETTLLWSGWVPYQLMTRELFAAGFRPKHAPSKSPIHTYPGPWQNGDRVVHVAFLGYEGSPFQAPGLAPASLATPRTLFVGDSARQRVTELDDGRRWQLLSERPEGFISVYERVNPSTP